MSTPRASGERLLADLARLAQFGARPDGGVDRVAGSGADLESRRWLAGRIREAGLDARQDETGNVFGRTHSGAGPWLLVGSHSDTVPAGGRLDGAYGVLAAIEVLRTLHEHRHPAADLVEVVSFWDEEGAGPRSDGGRTGSRALCAGPHLSELTGYLELHVEQGARMERGGLELAVVEGVVAIDRYVIVVSGAAGHAGTTAWEDRHDAGLVVAEVAAQVRTIVREVDPAMIGNVGCLELEPGAPNVVPGRASMVVELRSAEVSRLDRAAARLRELAERTAVRERCTASVSRLSRAAPAVFDARLRQLLDESCRRSGRPTGRLHSYAGHDAAVLCQHVPTAMLFVPSAGGVSHAPQEHTPDGLLVAGCQALLDGVVAVAGELPGGSAAGTVAQIVNAGSGATAGPLPPPGA